MSLIKTNRQLKLKSSPAQSLLIIQCVALRKNKAKTNPLHLKPFTKQLIHLFTLDFLFFKFDSVSNASWFYSAWVPNSQSTAAFLNKVFSFRLC